MLETEVAVIGGGPAGLPAAIEAARAGAKVLLISEDAGPGGQLSKQIHKFFGSSEHYAGTRGFDIGKKLLQEVEKKGVETWLDSTVYAIFIDKSLGVFTNGRMRRLKAKKIIFACGASEKVIHFPGWTLPGVMGAGAAQTMVNIHRVLPGRRFLMVGSGNVGLVVSYQLLQAGAEVLAVVEGLPEITGYGVHASKIRRVGVPILTSYTVAEAYGRDKVEGATVVAVNENWKPVPRTEKRYEIDVICLAVGLKPNIELPQMAGCEMMYSPILGGLVPVHDDNMETTEEGIYVVGDCAGVEEASTAIESGRLAGVAAAEELGYLSEDKALELKTQIRRVLDDLRGGPFGEARRLAKQKLMQKAMSLRGV